MGTSLLWGQGSPRVQLSAPQTQKALDQGLFLPWILPRSMDPNFYSIPETFCSAFPPSSILFIFHYSLQSPHSRVGRQESSWPRERRKTGWMPLAAPSRPQLCPPRPSSLRTPAPLWGPTRAIALGGDTHIHGRQTLARGGGGRAGTALVPPRSLPAGTGRGDGRPAEGSQPPSQPLPAPAVPCPWGSAGSTGTPAAGGRESAPRGPIRIRGGRTHTQPLPTPRRNPEQPLPAAVLLFLRRSPRGRCRQPRAGPGRYRWGPAASGPGDRRLRRAGRRFAGNGAMATAPWQRGEPPGGGGDARSGRGGGRRRQGTEGPPRARAAPGARSAAPRSAAAPRGRQPRRAEASASPEPRRGFRPRQSELRVRPGRRGGAARRARGHRARGHRGPQAPPAQKGNPG